MERLRYWRRRKNKIVSYQIIFRVWHFQDFLISFFFTRLEFQRLTLLLVAQCMFLNDFRNKQISFIVESDIFMNIFFINAFFFFPKFGCHVERYYWWPQWYWTSFLKKCLCSQMSGSYRERTKGDRGQALWRIHTKIITLAAAVAHMQGDQLSIAVFFWYLVKSDFSRVRYSPR